jgi:ABC-type polysaccharide/polyol phosphate export permease
MLAYCSAIWRCRYFWLSLVKLDLRSRYRGSLLGLGWSLAHPLAMTAIFFGIFCKLFDQSPAYYTVNVLTGMACWTFLVNTTLIGCNCFSQAEVYIRQHPAPMAIYPLRTVLGNLFHFLVALMLGLVLSLILVGRCNAHSLLGIPAALVLLLLLGWSLAVLGGLAHVYFRDTRHLSEIAFQVLFYVTPIFYPAEILEKRGLGMVLEFNPLLPFLKLFRMAIVEGEVPSVLLYGRACAIVAAAVFSASFALSRLERRLIFHL